VYVQGHPFVAAPSAAPVRDIPWQMQYSVQR